MKVLKTVTLMVAVVATLAISRSAVYAAKTDERIESSAQKTYVFETYFKGDAIKIHSTDGVVTLTGTVLEESHKSLAEETVTGLPGVKSVDNRIEIMGATPTPKTDAWLITKVKTTLLFHQSVSSTIEVDVKNGIVTLRGTAANQAQKDLTTEYAKDVEGVKEVINEMVVSSTAKKHQTVGNTIDDVSITALVKTTLLYHRSTSALNTKVVTNRGVVTLSGKAANSAEMDLATKLASDVNGVKKVKNQMIIK